MGGLFGAVPDANWPGQKRSFSAQAKSASTKVPPGHICMWLCVTLRAHEITAIFVNGLLCIPGTQMTLLGVTLGRSTYQFGVPVCLGQFTWSWTPCRQRTSSFLAGYKIWWSHENCQKLRSFSPSTNPYIPVQLAISLFTYRRVNPHLYRKCPINGGKLRLHQSVYPISGKKTESPDVLIQVPFYSRRYPFTDQPGLANGDHRLHWGSLSICLAHSQWAGHYIFMYVWTVIISASKNAYLYPRTPKLGGKRMCPDKTDS